MVIQLYVSGPRGESSVLDLCQNEEQFGKMTVTALKEILKTKLQLASDFRVCYQSENLTDKSLLAQHGLRHMSTIQVLLLLPGGHL